MLFAWRNRLVRGWRLGPEASGGLALPQGSPIQGLEKRGRKGGDVADVMLQASLDVEPSGVVKPGESRCQE